MSDPHGATALRPSLETLVGRGEYRAAFELYRTRADEASPADAGEVQLLAATAAARLGDLAKASTLAHMALGTFERAAERDGRLRALNLVGAMLFEQGRLDEADAIFRQVLAAATIAGHAHLVARASTNLASLAHVRGDPNRAVSLYFTALESYASLNDPRGLAEAYHNLALTYRQLRAWRDAGHAADEAVHHAALQGDRALIALALMGRAELMIERRLWALAEDALDRADELTAEAGDELGRCEVRRVRSLLALHQGDSASALRHGLEALTEAERLGSTLLWAECAAACALAHRLAGDRESAERAHTVALEGFRRLGARDLLERFERDWSAETDTKAGAAA